jgi:hypothetical protein
MNEFTECDTFKCRFEWIDLSSNFFDISVYTPAAVVVILGVLVYKAFKKRRESRFNGKK